MSERESILSPELTATLNARVSILANGLCQFVSDIGLTPRVKITTEPQRNGKLVIVFDSRRRIEVGWGSGLSEIEKGMFCLLFKFLARSFAKPESSVNSLNLLTNLTYASSCLSEINLAGAKRGNLFLTELTGIPATTIPCIYGSTNGLNLAELWETIICTEALKACGQEAWTIFGTGGHDSPRSREMFQDSFAALPTKFKKTFGQFRESLGRTLGEQRIDAARRLIKTNKITFVPDEKIFAALGKNFSLGKLLLLAQIAGEDPKLFDTIRTSDLSAVCNQSKEGQKRLSGAVAEIGSEPAGFTYYAREVIIAADFPGFTLMPFKLTTHANIYKILSGYGALAAQNEDRGAILCPLQRQRIQTARQAEAGSDPCDVIVMAFLAKNFPENFARLTQDFAQTCRVLSPNEGIGLGTQDNRFIIENYFPLTK